MCNKYSLHAPFVFHASFACGFHFVFFSTCLVTRWSPGCKHASFHLIFTTASVSVCLTSSTTFPWHHIYVGSHSSSVYSHSMSIPHGDNFNLVPSNIFQLNCCISLNWSPIPSSSIRSLSLYASIRSLVFCSVNNTTMSVISNAFVPSVGNVGRDRRFIGGCSGTVLYLCSGITTLVKCSSNSMGVYMYPPFDQGWCASSHPSPTYLGSLNGLNTWSSTIY